VIVGTVEVVTRAYSQASVDGTMLQSSTIRVRNQLMLANMVEIVQLLSCDRESRMAEKDDRAAALKAYFLDADR
jgi:hypothetical protein